MIRSRIPVLCVILWLASAGAPAGTGQVLSLEELDDDGKTTPLGKRPLAIVDINSEIKVQLDPNALQARVARALGDNAVSDAMIKRAQALLEASRRGLDLIEPTTQAIETFSKSDKTPEAVAVLARALDQAAPAADSIFNLADQDPALRARLIAVYEEVLKPGVTRAARSRALFETAAVYAEELKRTVDEALRKEGAYVQLGAWIVQNGRDRPLHLDGFDEYPEGDYFVVDRWTLLPLNEQQREELKRLDAAANALNKEGIKGLLKVETAATGAVNVFLDRAQGCADKIGAAWDSLRAVAPIEAQSVLAKVKEAETDQQEYVVYVRSLRNKYSGESATKFSSGAALLESTHGDLVELQKRTQAFVSGQIDHAVAVRNQIETVVSNMNTAIVQTFQVLEECKQQMTSNVVNLAGQLADLVATIRLSQEINTDVLQFGEEVLKHTLDKVPQSTDLKLKSAGVRQAGDVVVLKLAAGGAQKPRRVLEERRLDLHRVLPHIEMAVGLAFADPLGRTEVENRFQVAPSYSILLKGFGDRGITYNRLLTPGIGVNISALDFNKDDTPELGLALVGSVFRDYFQIGYGYNVNEDSDFWFFGLRLPLASFTLPRPENEPNP